MNRSTLVMCMSGCAAMAVSAADIVLTEDTEIAVPAGETNAVEKLGGTGAFTLTKKGAGVLEIHEVANAEAKVVIEEGELYFVNARPTEVFRKAYFHVDASDLSTMEIETVNGTNFVNRWNDADGGAHFATNCLCTGWKNGPANLRTNPENRRPFISQVKQNGLPVVDFGSLLTEYNTNALGQALGYGASLAFDQQMPEDFIEGFTVVSDTDDVTEWPGMEGIEWEKMSPMAYFGSSCATQYRELFSARGLFKAGVELPFLMFTSRNTGVFPASVGAEGGTYGFFDNEVYLPYTNDDMTSIEPGFHLLMAIAKPGSYNRRIDCFAGSWCYSAATGWTHEWGGQRIGEYAVYTNSLTAAERSVLNRYLRVKWMRPSMAIAGITVRAGAKLSVDDSVKVDVASYRDEQGSSIELGRGAHHKSGVLRMADTAFHLDASDASSLVITAENGTNFVTRWNDTTGNGAYAEPNMFTGYYNQRTNPEKRLPFINPTIRQNGLPVMDFGSPILATYTNETGAAIGYGASMMISKDVEVAHFIAVVSDHEGFLDLPAGAIDCPAYLCSCTPKATGEQGVIAGVRGNVPNDGTYPALYANNGASANLYNGVNYFDNELVSAPKNYHPTAGFHVYDVSTVADTTLKCNRIARAARKSGAPNADAYGGYRYGEYMLFTEKLAEADRLAIYRALRTKWWGEAVSSTRSYANLTVPETSSFAVEYENLAVTGTLALGGTVTAPTVSAANLTALAAESEVEGALAIGEGAVLGFEQKVGGVMTTLKASSVTLPAAATVTLNVSDAKFLNGQSVKLIGATTVTGSVAGWTVTVNGETVDVALRVAADGVYVDFPKPGMMILIH